jgi:hypothetical protein
VTTARRAWGNQVLFCFELPRAKSVSNFALPFVLLHGLADVIRTAS